MEAIRFRYSQTSCFPITTSAYHHFFLVFGPIFLLGAMGWVMRGSARGPFDRCLGVLFLLAALGMPVAQYLMQVISDATNTPPPMLNVLRAQKYAYLVLMIYMAYLLAMLLERGTQRERVLIVIAGVMVTFLGSPAYFPHHWNRNAQQARALIKGERISGEPEALVGLTQWARQHTPKDSVFLLMHPRMPWFRMYALRGLVVSWNDNGPAFYNGPVTTSNWYRWNKMINKMSYKPTLEALNQLIKESGANYVGAPSSWSAIPTYSEVYEDSIWKVYKPPATATAPS